MVVASMPAEMKKKVEQQIHSCHLNACNVFEIAVASMPAYIKKIIINEKSEIDKSKANEKKRRRKIKKKKKKKNTYISTRSVN